jgi:hypothetical protein
MAGADPATAATHGLLRGLSFSPELSGADDGKKAWITEIARQIKLKIDFAALATLRQAASPAGEEAELFQAIRRDPAHPFF